VSGKYCGWFQALNEGLLDLDLSWNSIRNRGAAALLSSLNVSPASAWQHRNNQLHLFIYNYKAINLLKILCKKARRNFKRLKTQENVFFCNMQ